MKHHFVTGRPTPFVAFDIETTGLSCKRGERISSAAFRVHGITDEMLSGAPGHEEVIHAFRKFVGSRPLVAHNAGFDTGFLRYEYARLGLRLTNKCFCTLRLSRRLLPFLSDYRLASVYMHLFGDLPKGITLHHALDDARLVARIWLKLNKG